MGELEVRESLGNLSATVREITSRFDRHENAMTRNNDVLFTKIDKLQEAVSEARGGARMVTFLGHIATALAAIGVGHFWK